MAIALRINGIISKSARAYKGKQMRFQDSFNYLIK
jgi:hypothetical protein